MDHAQLYRYCYVMACGDETAASALLLEPDLAAVRAAVKTRRLTPSGEPLFAARPLLEEHNWSLLALVLPELAGAPRHRQPDLTHVAAALGKKLAVTQKAVDRLVDYLDVALFTLSTVDCPEFTEIVTSAKRLRPAVRKAVAAHLPKCATCTEAHAASPGISGVLSAVAPVPIPAELDDSTTTAELPVLTPAYDPDPEPPVPADPAPSTVYCTLPPVASVRVPLLRRPPVLVGFVVLVLLVAAVAGALGVAGTLTHRPTGKAAAEVPAALAPPSVTPPASPSSAASPSPFPFPSLSPSASASASARASRAPSSPPPAVSSAPPAAAALAAPADPLREVLPLSVKTPGCPGQVFNGACYAVQPFTLTLSVTVPAGFDEARLTDALTWTARTQTLTGPLTFRGRGNHARVTVTDDGRATPPTVWTVQATLTVEGTTYTSNEVTLRVYATTT